MVSREVKKARYDELIKQGMSPSEAIQVSDVELGEGYTSDKSQSEPKVKVVDAETGAEQDYEDFKNQIKTKYAEAKEDLSETKEDILAAAGLRDRAPLLKKVAGRVLKSFKPKPLTKEQKEIQQAYNEAKYRAQFEKAKAQGRASGFGGYNAARQPTKVKIVRTMKPPVHQDLPGGNMGMDIESGSNPVGHIPGVSEPVRYRMRERHPVGRIPAGRKEPVGRIPRGGREPVQYTPLNHPGANSLVSLGNARNPVNIGTGRVSTRIPRTEKVNVKFHAKKPKTATRKPKIETKVVTEKQFWEL